MGPQQRAKALRQEADQVMAAIRLREHCAPIGEPVPTGSYRMDLMMHPDIDLYLPETTVEAMLNLATALGKEPRVHKLVFEKGIPDELERGLYLKPVVEYGHWERLWKIDLWALPAEIIEAKQRELQRLKTQMTPDQRQRILEYKYAVLDQTGRTPVFSGLYIYRAVIDEKLTDFDKITAYLKANGIRMP
ncbi:MAG: hypothetical protein GXY33_14150 [Phycisphaerae bacterium]|nr:hypothetical protein [Phycisphaerae bacterium]